MSVMLEAVRESHNLIKSGLSFDTLTHTVKFNKEVKNIDLKNIEILCAFVI